MAKICYKCGIEKDVGEFYKNRSRKDGLDHYCKVCKRNKMKEYKKTPQCKKYMKRYLVEYIKTSKYKEYAKDYELERLHTPEVKSRKKLSKAVFLGKIAKPCICQGCGQTFHKAQLHGHHADYTRPLDVVWLCAQCHTDIHKYIDAGMPNVIKSEVK